MASELYPSLMSTYPGLLGQFTGSFYKATAPFTTHYQNAQGNVYQWNPLSSIGTNTGEGHIIPKMFIASTPKRAIERLRDEIKDWHGNILERNA